MEIRVNSDKQISVNADLSNALKSEVRQSLARFEAQLTRAEAHLSDVNSSSKRGAKDKRCLLEVRPAGRKPISVEDRGATVEQAVRGAAGKMKRLLQSSLGRAAHGTSRAALSAGKRAVRSSAGTLAKLRRIEEALSEISGQVVEGSPQLKKQMKSAVDALQKARLLAEAQQANDKPQRPAVAQIAAKKASVNSRGPKRKGVYQGRRKSWPKR